MRLWDCRQKGPAHTLHCCVEKSESYRYVNAKRGVHRSVEENTRNQDGGSELHHYEQLTRSIFSLQLDETSELRHQRLSVSSWNIPLLKIHKAIKHDASCKAGLVIPFQENHLLALNELLLCVLKHIERA